MTVINATIKKSTPINATVTSKGTNGWSPVLTVQSDGERRVLQVTDWQGGEGTKPDTGGYVGVNGLESDIADGVDIRGDQGIQGIQGDEGPAFEEQISGADEVTSLDNDNKFGAVVGGVLKWIDWENLKSAIRSFLLIDEDDLSSDSNTQAPTQQSTKAYVDSQKHLDDINAQTETPTLDDDDSFGLQKANGDNERIEKQNFLGNFNLNDIADVESGTFTPEYSAQTNSFDTITYSRQDGVYLREGNFCTVFGNIFTSNFVLGTATGRLIISGLPFTPKNNLFYTGVLSMLRFNISTVYNLGLQADPSGLRVFNNNPNNTSVNLSFVEVDELNEVSSSANRIIFTVKYEIA